MINWQFLLVASLVWTVIVLWCHLLYSFISIFQNICASKWNENFVQCFFLGPMGAEVTHGADTCPEMEGGPASLAAPSADVSWAGSQLQGVLSCSSCPLYIKAVISLPAVGSMAAWAIWGGRWLPSAVFLFFFFAITILILSLVGCM